MLPNILTTGTVFTIGACIPEKTTPKQELSLMASLYPTMVIAGLVSLSILGTSGAGCAAFLAFTAGGALSFAAITYAAYIDNEQMRDNFTIVYLCFYSASSIVNAAAGVHLLISNPFSAVTLASTLLSGTISVITCAFITSLLY
jgi:hypothetical protein